MRLLKAAACGLFVFGCHPREGRAVSIVNYAGRQAPVSLNGQQIDLLLLLHNQERSRFGSPPLAWDAGLATGAEQWAARIGGDGILEHSGVEALGENLWMGTAGHYRIEDMVGAWAEERQDFRPGRFPDVSRTGNWSAVGHYTQMIWRDTQSVGCGLYRGRTWEVLVCRYAPAGNVMGDPVP
ncbi:hypothetical protein GV829_08930 [Sphingomonas lacunae]|uniref:SCP domain-containing protein n=1 Tax=Sphingomonas lacunae TaxID=2698828 RepID=A0A6M4ATV8_9SPHN|nr:CAP domain-containing protein [Sphingomonas lacunae]QJQ32558.1 hypothetical protein GV829_08930 [Sphingomonas lacunae]